LPIEVNVMMNGSMDGWYMGMGSGGWMFGLLLVVIVAAVVVMVRRK